MRRNSAPTDLYIKEIDKITTQLTTLRRKRSRVGWARFACIVFAIAVFYQMLPSGIGIACISALVFIAIFLRLVVIAINNNDKINNLQRLSIINQEELKLAAGEFYHRPDGSAYLPPVHDYAHDLDIFGTASIYQYINRTTSEQGRELLANWLLSPAARQQALNRQEAVKELAPQVEWRQQLEAHGMEQQITVATQDKLKWWISQPNKFITKPHWKVFRFLLPGIIILALLLNIFGILPSPIFYLLVFIFLLLSGYISKRIMPDYVQLGRIVSEISTLNNSIKWIENRPFKSPLLLELQEVYRTKNTLASIDVSKLRAILDRMDLRLNPFLFIPLNIFTFWDLQHIFSLEKWKEKNSEVLMQWFKSLAAIEALSTLAAVHFNHPAWTFPILDEKEGTFMANELGHPLIAENKRVTSSFATAGLPQIALITGSNMAGKSTFLRSIGLNIVLAMSGSPVCAASCTVSPVRVVSSMRISDNLAESTSTFYAELKKLKYIIEAVNNKEKVFLLLDEILRGTNSLDRHTGSHALINQLVRHNAVGMLATHDLELAKLVEEHPDTIHNYHFDVQVENDELYFDYKLKEGVCKSLNASILMKKIGIEL